MNDKQQLAAIGEQLTAMGERMGVQVQPLCMARRIEELEAQLAEKSIKVERLREMNLIAMKRVDGMLDRDLELSRLQSLMSEGWQLVPVEPAFAMLAADGCKEHHEGQECTFHKNRRRIWAAMLAAAPSPDGTK